MGDATGAAIARTEAYGFEFAYPAGDVAVGRCLREFGEFGRVGSTLGAQLARGGTFIDVGANVGCYALPIARSARLVVAIEAQPSIAELLELNVGNSGLENISIIHAAAGAESGEIDFPAPDLAAVGNFGAVGIGRTKGPTQRVRMIRLDDVAPADTRVVKIDVEGYEAHVLNGSHRLLAETRPLWIVEVSKDGSDTRAIIDGLKALNYRTYWFYDPFVTPRASRGKWSLAEPGDISVFAVPAAVPQPREMPEIGKSYEWPTSLAPFKYLKAFGFLMA